MVTTINNKYRMFNYICCVVLVTVVIGGVSKNTKVKTELNVRKYKEYLY